jgi:hypothetical protein
LFNQWKLSDRLVLGITNRDFYENKLATLNSEAVEIGSRYGYENITPSKLSSRSIVELLCKLADQFNVEIVVADKVGSPRCILRHRISETSSMFLEWFDHKLFRLNGKVQFRFVISNDDAVSWEADNFIPEFVTDIGNIVPGALHYAHAAKFPSQLALSAFAYLNVMKLCRQPHFD